MELTGFLLFLVLFLFGMCSSPFIICGLDDKLLGCGLKEIGIMPKINFFYVFSNILEFLEFRHESSKFL
jgi:hypothetical protein